MGWGYFIKVIKKHFYIGKSSVGCMFMTNIFGWVDLVEHLQKTTSVDLESELLTLYAMCQVAKNNKDQWDGKIFTVKKNKAIFSKIIDLVKQNKGFAYDEDYYHEDCLEDRKPLKFDYILKRLFQTHHQNFRLAYSDLVLLRGCKYRMNYKSAKPLHCNRCFVGQYGTSLCDECREKAYGLYILNKDSGDSEDSCEPDSFLRKYHFTFDFYAQRIGGVMCNGGSGFS